MSALVPGIGSPNVGQTGGVGSVGSPGVGGDVDLGQFVGGLGAMDLLQNKRALDVHFNAVDVALALQQHRDRSAKQVIASLA